MLLLLSHSDTLTLADTARGSLMLEWHPMLEGDGYLGRTRSILVMDNGITGNTWYSM